MEHEKDDEEREQEERDREDRERQAQHELALVEMDMWNSLTPGKREAQIRWAMR